MDCCSHREARPLLFYCLAYRAAHGVASARLIALVALPPDAGHHPIREFFGWRPAERVRSRAPDSVPRGATTV